MVFKAFQRKTAGQSPFEFADTDRFVSAPLANSMGTDDSLICLMLDNTAPIYAISYAELNQISTMQI